MSKGFYIPVKCGSSDVEAKRSHFLGCLSHIESEDGARSFIADTRKEHYDARHHCFALRLWAPGSPFERSGDDGEPQGTAGKPMLDILKGAELYDVCAVVTRYFGGTLLGTGGLVRAYSESLKEALSASELGYVEPGTLLRVNCGYTALGRLKRYAAEKGLVSLDESYGEDCSLSYVLKEGTEDGFREGVMGLSLGKALVHPEAMVLFYTSGKPYIYRTVREL